MADFSQPQPHQLALKLLKFSHAGYPSTTKQALYDYVIAQLGYPGIEDEPSPAAQYVHLRSKVAFDPRFQDDPGGRKLLMDGLAVIHDQLMRHQVTKFDVVTYRSHLE